MPGLRATILGFVLISLLLGVNIQESAAQTVNVTTAEQDTPLICSGCVYRTGQNLGESGIHISPHF
jgi:hypothetical protein